MASFDKRHQKYRAHISINNKPRHIGFFNTEAEADEATKIVKRWLRRRLVNSVQKNAPQGGIIKVTQTMSANHN